MSESSPSSLSWGIPIVSGTVGGLTPLRLIDSNLIYLIKEKILPENGYTSRITEVVTPGAQEIDPITGFVVTPYKSTYYDWVYFNPDPSNLDLLVKPTLSSSGSLAYVDYYNGTVFYSGTQSAQVTMTYDYYSATVQDGFPELNEDNGDLSINRLPVISVDYSSRKNEPFAIGGAFQENRIFFIDIIAASDPQRDDLNDILETSFRYTYRDTIDYNFGFPTLFNGDINPNFDRGPATRWKEIRFQNVYSKVIRNPTEFDKLRHRAVITANIQSVDF